MYIISCLLIVPIVCVVIVFAVEYTIEIYEDMKTARILKEIYGRKITKMTDKNGNIWYVSQEDEIWNTSK